MLLCGTEPKLYWKGTISVLVLQLELLEGSRNKKNKFVNGCSDNLITHFFTLSSVQKQTKQMEMHTVHYCTMEFYYQHKDLIKFSCVVK